jgi:hypothetical protein
MACPTAPSNAIGWPNGPRLPDAAKRYCRRPEGHKSQHRPYQLLGGSMICSTLWLRYFVWQDPNAPLSFGIEALIAAFIAEQALV